MEIRTLDSDDLEPLAHLFDQYRAFYRQPSDLDGARSFLSQRLTRGDSAIFGALINDDMVGFVQLYPSYTSVGMGRMWILNDLYVHADARRKGVAVALMNIAREFAEMTESALLVLATEKNNTQAQALYEKLGYQRDEDFHHYELALDQ